MGGGIARWRRKRRVFDEDRSGGRRQTDPDARGRG